MGRPIRNTNAEYIRHISCRTLNAQLLMIPGEELNNIIGGIIAKYQQQYGIIIYAVIVLSNHYHILAKAPKQNLWKFEQRINSEISKRVNALRHRRGYFWERRYDEQICPQKEDIYEAMLYILCNPVNHGLVRSPEQWPGICTYKQSLGANSKSYPVVNYTEYGKAYRRAKRKGEKVSIAEYTEWFELKISRPPVYENLNEAEWREHLRVAVKARCAEIAKTRAANNQGFLGAENIKRQSHKTYPREVKRQQRPVCFSQSLETKRQFKEWFYPWMQAYRQASKQFRSFIWETVFPPDCLRPSLHYCLA